MKKHYISIIFSLLALMVFTGCGKQNIVNPTKKPINITKENVVGENSGDNETKDKDNKDNDKENNANGGVTVIKHIWSGDTAYPSGSMDKETFYDLKSGDVLYEGFHCLLTVKSISDKELILDNQGLVETNKDGGTDLMANSPETITIQVGKTIELSTQTLDAGARIEITYNKERSEKESKQSNNEKNENTVASVNWNEIDWDNAQVVNFIDKYGYFDSPILTTDCIVTPTGYFNNFYYICQEDTRL